MAELDEMGRWKCDAPGCKAAATHEYLWLGRPVVACVLHMEEALQLAKSIGWPEVEASLRPMPTAKPLNQSTKDNQVWRLIGSRCQIVPVVNLEPVENDVEDYWGE